MINELREYTGLRAPSIASAIEAQRIQDAIERRADLHSARLGEVVTVGSIKGTVIKKNKTLIRIRTAGGAVAQFQL